MTKEEIIEGLKLLEDNMVYFDELLNDKGKWIDVHELLFEAIEVLEKKPCEDAISRQAVLEQINCWIGSGEYRYTNATHYLTRRMQDLPPVIPQQKTGHWIRWYEQKETDGYIENIPHCKCSKCDKEYDPHLSKFIKYCNECGAKMSEPQESEG